MKLESLSEDSVQDGKAHPFVEALIEAIRERMTTWMVRAVDTAEKGEGTQRLGALAGRACEAKEIMLLIQNAKGKPE